MNDFVPKDMSGQLFRNDRKETDSHPDHRGSCVVEGVEYWISAWVNEGKKGKYFSLKFQEKNNAPAPKSAFDNIDEDIPF